MCRDRPAQHQPLSLPEPPQVCVQGAGSDRGKGSKARMHAEHREGGAAAPRMLSQGAGVPCGGWWAKGATQASCASHGDPRGGESGGLCEPREQARGFRRSKGLWGTQVPGAGRGRGRAAWGLETTDGRCTTDGRRADLERPWASPLCEKRISFGVLIN